MGWAQNQFRAAGIARTNCAKHTMKTEIGLACLGIGGLDPCELFRLVANPCLRNS